MILLRIENVQRSAGRKSKTSIYQDVRDGLFTKPVRLGKRSVGWPDYEVQDICRARVAGWSDHQIRELVDQLHSRRTDGEIRLSSFGGAA
jgi:prophage regulatory protein